MASPARTEALSQAATTADIRRELVARVLASQHFSKSERLSSFLAYVCDLTLTGRAGEINEQRIGEAVFGRSTGYDSTIDGIVRTQASRLRQKLDLYFDGEGAEEPSRIIIPRGGYVPHFVPRSPVPATPAESIPAIRPVAMPAGQLIHVATPHRGPTPMAWIMVGILLVLIAGMALRGGEFLPRARPHHPLWSRMFPADRQTLLVPADSTLVFWQSVTKQNIGLADYLTGAFRQNIPPGATESEKLGVRFANGRYTSIVDVEVASRLSQIAQRERGETQIRYARDVRPNDLKQGNIILIGANEANPWVYLFEKDMNFIFRNDRQRELFSVINRSPRNGELQQWDSSYTEDKEHRVYAVVAFVPNLSGNGDVLILEGTSMAGTECAWDFVADDSQLLDFLQQIRHGNTIPHFELVLGSNNMSGSAVRATILAWRVDH